MHKNENNLLQLHCIYVHRESRKLDAYRTNCIINLRLANHRLVTDGLDNVM